MKKFNWGIIGTGWIAHDMADALNKVNGEIYAAANPNEEALRAFVQEKHVQHAFTNPDEMIKDPSIDIIYIATPTHFPLRLHQKGPQCWQARLLRKGNYCQCAAI